MDRYLETQVRKDLGRKMVFVAGPRQCGKTTLAKSILSRNKGHYLNWDDPHDRDSILRHEFPSGKGLIVFDELHKYARWRNMLKGLFDKRRDELRILVTGSARLDYYRRGGDSLQGRYHLLRMHPLSIAELDDKTPATLGDLLRLGGFPEPYLSGSEQESRRWSREYRSRLVHEDLQTLETVSEVSLVERLVMRLPDCVGSPLSINSLREDMEVSHPTLSRWVGILENLYCIFRVYPFGSPRIRAVKKEAKHYHLDWTAVQNPGPRFENLVACHLLKWCHWIEDTEGHDMELRYFRDNEKREVDFVVVRNRKPVWFIECKYGDRDLSPSLRYLARKHPEAKAVQLCFEADSDVTNAEGIRICNAAHFLRDLI
jgi:predicted AAA+ superfamily ATPase